VEQGQSILLYAALVSQGRTLEPQEHPIAVSVWLEHILQLKVQPWFWCAASALPEPTLLVKAPLPAHPAAPGPTADRQARQAQLTASSARLGSTPQYQAQNPQKHAAPACRGPTLASKEQPRVASVVLEHIGVGLVPAQRWIASHVYQGNTLEIKVWKLYAHPVLRSCITI
jgi:hypothetical protein